MHTTEFTRGSKKVAYVRVVRHSGRTLDLKAPLVTRDISDSKFDDKVRALREAFAFHIANRDVVDPQQRASAS